MPFVDSTRLLVKAGMTGATGNIYCGLHEFEDMAFVLHVLRPGDLFVDVGANVGSYSVLAAGVAGANCVSFEPVPKTFAYLEDNIRLNNLGTRVLARNIGIGSAVGTLTFTAGLDTVNHVIASSEITTNSIQVSVQPLDFALDDLLATLIKIDVEGFETEVLNGATETMISHSLRAVVMELNGSGSRYGFDENALHERMLGWGFVPVHYEPLERLLTVVNERSRERGNTIYVRDIEFLQERIRLAPYYSVRGRLI